MQRLLKLAKWFCSGCMMSIWWSKGRNETWLLLRSPKEMIYFYGFILFSFILQAQLDPSTDLILNAQCGGQENEI